ncbi:hypothetical protein [Enterococcus devriesei]|nr:hypothetical protein [Enterococcus sp.]
MNEKGELNEKVEFQNSIAFLCSVFSLFRTGFEKLLSKAAKGTGF